MVFKLAASCYVDGSYGPELYGDAITNKTGYGYSTTSDFYCPAGTSSDVTSMELYKRVGSSWTTIAYVNRNAWTVPSGGGGGGDDEESSS